MHFYIRASRVNQLSYMSKCDVVSVCVCVCVAGEGGGGGGGAVRAGE